MSFFSSRRRHTRWPRDWSSDVCSSDLRFLSREEGIFVEPGSAASVAGLLKTADAGRVPDSATIAVTVTGHGLKDPSWALHTADGSEIETQRVSVDAVSAARALGLEDS